MGNSHYKHLQQETLKQRDQSLNFQSGLIDKLSAQLKIDIVRAFQIANMAIPEIVQKLNQAQLTSQQLLTALALRIIKIARQFNLITYLYFQKGLAIAKKCDEERRLTKKKNITIRDLAAIKDDSEYQNFFPPLYGIPISIKDAFHFQGREATLGLISRANKKSEESILIECFRNSGMIPFVQTNVPQLCMATETGNFLWGRSLNPWNKQRAVGGSSGGEGALISARCSVLGLGSDIGGSIRIPSDHNGVFGLKPNSSRISNTYHASLSKEFEAFSKIIPNCLGPLGKSAEDLALFMSVVTNQKFYQEKQDPYTKIIPFNSRLYISAKQSSKKLKIGYIDTLKDIQPSLASQRALNEVLQILRNDGHQLVKVQIPNERQVIRQFLRQYMSCGGRNFKKMLQGQKAVKQYQSFFLLGQLRAPGRFLLSNIAKYFMPRTYFYFLQKKPQQTPMDYQEHVGEIQELRNDWIKYWRQQSLDFVISPGFGCQAFPHEKSDRIGIAAAYTFIWNLLDMTVGAMPVTTVRQDQQQYVSNFRDILTYDLKEVCKSSAGLPVGIQVVGLPYNEEKVLGLMSNLEGKIKFYHKFGAPRVQ